ncbi:hypothetical protein D3C75_880840 [compost metagenome]
MLRNPEPPRTVSFLGYVHAVNKTTELITESLTAEDPNIRRVLLAEALKILERILVHQDKFTIQDETKMQQVRETLDQVKAIMNSLE